MKNSLFSFFSGTLHSCVPTLPYRRTKSHKMDQKAYRCFMFCKGQRQKVLLLSAVLSGTPGTNVGARNV